MIAEIIAAITKAAELVEQGVAAYERVRPSIDNITGPKSPDLESAQQRFQMALERANEAGQSLDQAIADRLGE